MLLLGFILGCVACCLLLFAIMLYVLLANNVGNKPAKTFVDKSVDKPVDNFIAMNVAHYEDRLLELQQDMAENRISQQMYAYQKKQLQAQSQQAQLPPITIEANDNKDTNIKIIFGLCLLIGVVSSALYFVSVGGTNSKALFSYWQDTHKVKQVANDLLIGKINNPPNWLMQDSQNSQYLVTALQENVHKNTNANNGAMRWFRLANFYMKVGATDSALSAMARAYRLQPTNNIIVLGYIELDFLANGHSLTATNKQRLQAFLATHPNNQKAMMLMAMGETTANHYNQALIWVDKLKSVILQQASQQNEQKTVNQALTNEANKALANLQQLRAIIVDKQKAVETSVSTNND